MHNFFREAKKEMSSFIRKRKKEVIGKEKEKLFAKVKEALEKSFNISQERLTLSARFREDFHFDSIDTVQANIVLEDTFGLEIPDQDIEKILTVKDLVDYLYLKLNSRK